MRLFHYEPAALFVTAIALFVMPMDGLAQEPVRPSPVDTRPQLVPFFGAGVAVGTGDLSVLTDPGWMAFGGFDVPLGDAGISLGVTASHARVGYEGGFDEESQTTMVTADLGYAYTGLAPRRVTPFVRAGLGLRVERYEPGRLAATSSSETGLGGTASAGVAVTAGPTALVLGAHFSSGRNAGHWGAHGGIAVPVRF